MEERVSMEERNKFRNKGREEKLMVKGCSMKKIQKFNGYFHGVSFFEVGISIIKDI